MTKPLISVVIPVYNTLNYIQKGIESVLNQTYKNVELIIINDGSTDGSKELLDQANEKSSKVTVFHQENQGVSAARNKGLDLVHGEYVCFLDSDDWLSEDAIEFLYNQIKDEENIISACDRNFVNIRNGELIIERQRDKQAATYFSVKEALLETGTGKLNLQSACYKLFPVKIINGNKKIRFNRKISHGEDGLFVFEVMNSAKGIVFSTEPKWNIVERVDSATNSGYSSKMLSALEAVDIMISKSEGKDTLQNQLKIYYTERAMGLTTVYSIGEYKDKDEREKLKRCLRKYKKGFLRADVGLTKKAKFYLALYSPEEVIRLLYGIKKVKNGG